jgi:hypothetical protein
VSCLICIWRNSRTKTSQNTIRHNNKHQMTRKDNKTREKYTSTQKSPKQKTQR